jgi:hypothetical protein
VDCSVFFTEDGLSVHPVFLQNIEKFIEFAKKSGLSLKYLSTEEAKKELQKEKSHKNVDYASAMIWFKDVVLNHFFVVLPGEPGIVWVRNDPLAEDTKFHLLYSEISDSPPCYLSTGNTFFKWNCVTTTPNRMEALTFQWKRLSGDGKKVLKTSDIVHLCTEGGMCLEAFWTGIYLVPEKKSYGWKIEYSKSDEIHIDDTVTLVSQKYPDQKLIWNGSLTTSHSSGYWRFCYTEAK